MGRVADRYRRRIANVGPATARLRGDAAKALVEGLQTAVDEEMTNVTPLPHSGKMRASVQAYFLGNSVVQVGFNLRKARHARRRLNLTGISPSGGHKLDMRPAPIVARVADPKIRVAARVAQKRMLSG